MVGPVKTRLACDRCHGQKLRCPKQAGSRVCSGVPAPSFFGQANGDMNLNNSDWPMPFANDSNGNGSSGFSFDELMQMASADGSMLTGDTANLFAGLAPGATAPTAVNPAESAGTAATPKTASDNTSGTTLTYRLAKLVADTDLLYEALPEESTRHTPLEIRSSGDSDGTAPGSDGQAPFLAFLNQSHYSRDKFAKKEFLERVFDITQRLSTAYADAAPKKAANRSSRNSEAEKTCDADDCLHTVELPGNLSTLEAAFLKSGVSARKARSSDNDIDLTVAPLLVAAHTRILDVLVRILHGIFACYRLRVATSTLDDAEMQLPDLMIGGSFVPPKGSAALVHAFLLRHLLDSLQTGVERYWAKLKDADDEDSSGGGEKSIASRERNIAALQFGLLKERHDATLHHLVVVGTDLASTGLIK